MFFLGTGKRCAFIAQDTTEKGSRSEDKQVLVDHADGFILYPRSHRKLRLFERW